MLSEKPIDMKRSMSYGSNYFICHSLKLNRRVCFYSNLEYANFLSVELNPQIIKYVEQPLQITGVNDDGKICKTVFDMEVLYEDNINELWEIKYSCDLTGYNQTAVRAMSQISIQKNWCLKNNVPYCVRTEKDIFNGLEHLNNMRFMYHCICRTDEYLLINSKKRIKRLIEQIGSTTIGHILECDPEPSLIFPSLIYLLIHGQIDADIFNQELNYDTEVSYVKYLE
jgi:hypothetical protein